MDEFDDLDYDNQNENYVSSSRNKEVIDRYKESGLDYYDPNFGTNISQEIDNHIIKSRSNIMMGKNRRNKSETDIN